MPIAITRQVSPSISRCELTHLRRQPIDFERARTQHEAYERCLRNLGCTVLTLAGDPDLPDCVFVEDTVVVVDEMAVVARPGAPPRRREVAAVAAALAPLRPVVHIAPPATLDGGDVLRIGRRLYVGLSSRTNREALDQLRAHLSPLGYSIEGVAVAGCLHLKTAVTAPAPDTVLVNPAWVDAGVFASSRVVEVDPEEPHAANSLPVGGVAIFPDAFPRTAARLAKAGIEVVPVDVSELSKAEGAVTCCSVIVQT